MDKKALEKKHEYFTAVHAFVRMMLLNHEFEEAYEKIAVHMFPLYASAKQRNAARLNTHDLQEHGKQLYSLDEADHLVTSCVSIALTIQSILFSNGCNADLLIGVKKIDDKLFSHAWVQLENGDSIDPNNKNKDLRVLQTYNMTDYAERWVLSLI
ncbi:lasso peptide biosynthesis B2 protein [Bacillus swezeyi]|uniref:Microcin J25-processing protein McjB C-terminal domain-containing protein n=1 Tax=Bacillus swezeyi TaxID=1925020 RepID=A0A1R1QWU6_9BACI|nr:lasso peptide biosynthesis B2 protein [Bacillus swezeyi]MEC1259171.1 lasso peptide biosynthesis B2 protein [Bacillus swezeyi]MED1740496.1 lasso peptide biosynthesis B2 protein [Bacillus swezeyi]MED2927868.1 lasso peptide biosynthesis B2 protein [Bacillus swezeyi]MED2965220.1 lasso peptide biosynthesis B2 protein [Bacillus swezeyi]MED2977675.1 lasso peptide biosynthesis B2 protein [Bacillus swezeyi]